MINETENDLPIGSERDSAARIEPLPEGEARPQIDDLIPRLIEMKSGLRPAEKRVAEVVLKDVESAIRASNSQLAQAAGVSEPTVTRFCRTVGCEGVRDFKLRLAQSLVAGAGVPGAAENAVPHYWTTVFGQARHAINLAERQLEPETVNAAIDQLAKAKRIFVFGLGGGSTSLALDMQYRLFRFGLSVTAYSDSYLIRMVVATARPGDVVIAISATGRTRELIDSVKIAKRYNATVIALTRPGTELAALANVSLTIEVPEIVNVLKPTASRFAFLSALDLLATGVAYRMGAEAHQTIRRVKLNLLRIRGGEILEPLGD